MKAFGVPARALPQYRQDVAEHIAREGKAAALAWLRALELDLTEMDR